MLLNSLSGRFLILTTIFVMLAEVMIFVPSVARFREDYLLLRLERAQIASLALLADDMIEPRLEEQLLTSAGVYNVVLRRDDVRELMLSSPLPQPVARSFDLRNASAWTLIRDAMSRLFHPEDEVIRVIGTPLRGAGSEIEVTTDSAPLRSAMIDYGLNILFLSLVISVITALLLFFAVRFLFVKPVERVVDAMQSYAAAPEDSRRILTPKARLRELRNAEDTLHALETQLTSALKQKARLAQLGGAVAKISHDLRNILTTAQLFTDRMEHSQDPAVRRVMPKLLNSMSRAVHLCESTLAFGRAEEPTPMLERVALEPLLDELIENETLAAGSQNLQFETEIPPNFILRADPEQLYRVLANLVRNARQALSGQPQAGLITVRAGERDEVWLIDVSDNGPGLPEKAREHLFQPFQGGVRSGGTGLGLAIAAELMRGHGGTLELRDSSSDGTCFRLCLPKSATAMDAVATE